MLYIINQQNNFVNTFVWNSPPLSFILIDMKWPTSLTFIRHGESEYNALKAKKKGITEYEEFVELFHKEFAMARDEHWPSERLIEYAKKIWDEFRLESADYDIEMTDIGRAQARKTGEALQGSSLLPDIIFVSPYLRTRQTLEEMQKGWSDLKRVRVISEERVREQEHGLSNLFCDWRVHFVMNPLQGLLYKLEGDYAYRFLNGENKADVRDRVRSFLSTMVRECANQTVMVISHHLTLLSLRANIEHWDREKFAEVNAEDKPINCGVTIYRGDPYQGENGKLILDIYNKKYY